MPSANRRIAISIVFPLLAAAAVLCIGALLAGCSTSLAKRSSPAAAEVQWPPAPEPARIRFLYSFASAEEFGIKPGLVSRVLGRKTAAALQRPIAVAVSAEGASYVADLSGAIFLFDKESRTARKQSLTCEGTLSAPVSLALGENDSVYAVDSERRKVYVYDRNLEPVRVFASGFQRPAGISYDSTTHRFAVVDAGSDSVRVFNYKGDEVAKFGGRGETLDDMHTPTHLWWNQDGMLVTDALNSRIKRLSADGRTLGVIGKPGQVAGSFARPKGVARDSRGHIYVVDALFANIQIFDDAGQLLLIFGGFGGLEPGGFSLPNGLFIDGQDRIYVADTYHSRVQVFQYQDPNDGLRK